MAGNPRIHGPSALRIIGSVFLIIGVAGLVAAAGMAFDELRSPRSASADGVVAGFEYGPVVQFKTIDGAVIRFSSGVRSSFWHAGDRVAVAYAPNNPNDAAIDGFAGRWFLPGLFAGLALVFALIGLGLVLSARMLARRGGSPVPGA